MIHSMRHRIGSFRRGACQLNIEMWINLFAAMICSSRENLCLRSEMNQEIAAQRGVEISRDVPAALQRA